MNSDSVETEEKTSRPISWLLILIPNSFSSATTSSSASTESSPSPSPNSGASSSIISGLIPSRLRLSTIRRLIRAGMAAISDMTRTPLVGRRASVHRAGSSAGHLYTGRPILTAHRGAGKSQTFLQQMLTQ